MARRKKCKVFVSYSRHDEGLVKPLASRLGLTAKEAVFLDVEQLKPGDQWEAKITAAIKESLVVLCWCCKSKNSEFVAREIRMALRDERKRLVPVLFCSTDLPPDLSSRQWIDLRGKIIHVCDGAHEKEKPKDGDLILGIDFGTSNSVIAVRGGKVEILDTPGVSGDSFEEADSLSGIAEAYFKRLRSNPKNSSIRFYPPSGS
jgi:hypothetical protein